MLPVLIYPYTQLATILQILFNIGTGTSSLSLDLSNISSTQQHSW